MAKSMRPLTIHPITTRNLTVLRVEDVTPGMRRVTLGGPQLKAHTADNGFPVDAIPCDGFDDHIKMMFRDPDLGPDEPTVIPSQADGVLNWPEDKRLCVRSYTIRAWRPDAGEHGEVDLDFVKHGFGPATTWAYTTEPGENIQIAGPKSCATQPEGADWVLIAGDETALPAIGRWLEEMSPDTTGQVFIEVDQDDHVQNLVHPDGITVTWLPRNGVEAGKSTALYDAITGTDWWDGTCFAWVAGETLTLTPIRRWLRREMGLAKEQVDVAGYWRYTEPVVDDSGEISGAAENTAAVFHELTEIFPGVAVRVAVTLGLGGILTGRRATLDDVVAETGADRTGLEKLLRYLAALELVDINADGYTLTRLGAEMDADHTIDHLSLTGVAGRREAGVLSLLAAVQTGTGDYARWFGDDFESIVQDDPELLRQRTEQWSDTASWSTAPMTQHPVFAPLGSVRVSGRSAADIALGLTENHPNLTVHLLATPAELDAATTVHPALAGHPRIIAEAGSPLTPPATPVDATLFAGGLNTLPDADAVHTLREATRRGHEILVFGKDLNETLAHDHDYEDDLLNFALYRSGVRTDAQNRALFSEAGLQVTDQSTVGWGFTLTRLAPR